MKTGLAIILSLISLAYARAGEPENVLATIKRPAADKNIPAASVTPSATKDIPTTSAKPTPSQDIINYGPPAKPSSTKLVVVGGPVKVEKAKWTPSTKEEQLMDKLLYPSWNGSAGGGHPRQDGRK